MWHLRIRRGDMGEVVWSSDRGKLMPRHEVLSVGTVEVL